MTIHLAGKKEEELVLGRRQGRGMRNLGLLDQVMRWPRWTIATVRPKILRGWRTKEREKVQHAKMNDIGDAVVGRAVEEETGDTVIGTRRGDIAVTEAGPAVREETAATAIVVATEREIIEVTGMSRTDMGKKEGEALGVIETVHHGAD